MKKQTDALWVIGLMSGTSLDGIDVALLQTNGQKIIDKGPSAVYNFSAEMKQKLQQLLGTLPQTPHVLDLEKEFTDLHVQCVRDFLKQHHIPLSAIDLIGFHGQTLFHKPPTQHSLGQTWQMGDGILLSNELKKPVVYDFRSHDVSKGGQGAPLIPIFHEAMTSKPSVIVNIGGVCNLTVCHSGDLKAFDCGPGNALIDDWVQQFGRAYDDGGRIAAKGTVHWDLIEKITDHPFFSSPPPKSLDRNAFKNKALDTVASLTHEDGAATLTALTAHCLFLSLQWLHNPPHTWYIAGGGVLNHTLMRMMQSVLPEWVELYPLSDLNWEASTLEAYGFAYLASRTYNNMPISFPSTTGAPHELTGGLLVFPV